MRKVHIIIYHILNDDNSIKIGGVETYTDNLASLFNYNSFIVIWIRYTSQNCQQGTRIQ